MDLLFIFITGLTTGGLSCVAVQGGLLASVIANYKQSDNKQSDGKNLEPTKMPAKNQVETHPLEIYAKTPDWFPVMVFLSAKLFVHTIAGFMLGWFGSVFTLNLGVSLAFQVATAMFMAATALNLLDVHPIFRYVLIQPPRWITRFIHRTAKGKVTASAIFTPALLGALTVLIPCGVTQAMEVMAMSSGNPWYGAAIMAVFTLGTIPLFALVGMTTARLSGQSSGTASTWQTMFTRFAATLLLVMALYAFNGVLLVLNAPITVQRLVEPVRYFFSAERFAAGQNTPTVPIVDGEQIVHIQMRNNGYEPNYVRVLQGQPVRLILSTQDTYSCAVSFVLKEFDILAFLKANDRQEFTFIPDKTGSFPFTCSMGMYSGTLEVV